jgi:hypothetical protein
MKISKGKKKFACNIIDDTPNSFIKEVQRVIMDIEAGYRRLFTIRLNYEHTSKWFVYDKNWSIVPIRVLVAE